MVGVGLDIWNEQQNDSPPTQKQDSHTMPIRPRPVAPSVPPMQSPGPQMGPPRVPDPRYSMGPPIDPRYDPRFAMAPVAPAPPAPIAAPVVSLGSDKSTSNNDNIFWMNIALVIIIILLVIIVFLLFATKKLLSKRNLTK